MTDFGLKKALSGFISRLTNMRTQVQHFKVVPMKESFQIAVQDKRTQRMMKSNVLRRIIAIYLKSGYLGEKNIFFLVENLGTVHLKCRSG